MPHRLMLNCELDFLLVMSNSRKAMVVFKFCSLQKTDTDSFPPSRITAACRHYRQYIDTVPRFYFTTVFHCFTHLLCQYVYKLFLSYFTKLDRIMMC